MAGFRHDGLVVSVDGYGRFSGVDGVDDQLARVCVVAALDPDVDHLTAFAIDRMDLGHDSDEACANSVDERDRSEWPRGSRPSKPLEEVGLWAVSLDLDQLADDGMWHGEGTP